MGTCSNDRTRKRCLDSRHRTYNEESRDMSSKISVNYTQNKERKNKNKNSLIQKEPENKAKNIIKSEYISQESNGISTLPREDIAFPKGEHYYTLINDSNIGGGNSIESNCNLCEKIELFFSLYNVCNPNNEHSFAISIINNKKIGTKTFLGNLENDKGDKIEFGKSIIINFFFEREQVIIIEPMTNGKKTGQKNEFVLCTLMTKRNNKLKIKTKIH